MSLWEQMTSQGVANLDPRGMVGFYYESMGANDIPGSSQFGPQGHGWQG